MTAIDILNKILPDGISQYGAQIDRKIIQAMTEYASLKEEEASVEFAEWMEKLTPTQRCTVHPPAGSGGGYGLYEIPTSELYQTFKNQKP